MTDTNHCYGHQRQSHGLWIMGFAWAFILASYADGNSFLIGVPLICFKLYYQLKCS